MVGVFVFGVVARFLLTPITAWNTSGCTAFLLKSVVNSSGNSCEVRSALAADSSYLHERASAKQEGFKGRGELAFLGACAPLRTRCVLAPRCALALERTP